MPNPALKEKQATLQRKMLGVKIRHARTRAGLALQDVSQALNLSADAVNEIEYGQRDVTLPQLEVLALLFNVPVIYFWSNDIISESAVEYPTTEAMLLRQRVIGLLLRQARLKAGRSEEELAKLAGISASTLEYYELGKLEIPLPLLETLASHLNVTLTHFLDQGLRPAGTNGQVTSLDDIANYAQLPMDVKEFLANPANLLYLSIAMKLSELSVDTLRALAEGLLEVTY